MLIFHRSGVVGMTPTLEKGGYFKYISTVSIKGKNGLMGGSLSFKKAEFQEGEESEVVHVAIPTIELD